MGNVKAIPTKDGLVVVFNKHELAHLKGGGISNLNLVSGGQNIKISFMRDTTFKRQEKRLQVIAASTEEQEAELKKDIEDISNDLV